MNSAMQLVTDRIRLTQIVRDPAGRTITKLIGALAIIVLVQGCAGTHSRISASDANYPVSFSPAVRDASGVVRSDDDFKVLGRFTHRHESLHVLFGLIPLGSVNFDLSEEINQQVSAVGGQAIVNLKVMDFESGWPVFSCFPFLGLLPTPNDVKVVGDIVRLATPGEKAPVEPTLLEDETKGSMDEESSSEQAAESSQ